MECAGLDPAEMISQLRAAHAEDETKMGVEVVSGHAGDMEKLGIFESFKVGHVSLSPILRALECNAAEYNRGSMRHRSS